MTHRWAPRSRSAPVAGVQPAGHLGPEAGAEPEAQAGVFGAQGGGEGGRGARGRRINVKDAGAKLDMA